MKFIGYRTRDQQRAKLIEDGKNALWLANTENTFEEILQRVGGSRARLYRAIKAARNAGFGEPDDGTDGRTNGQRRHDDNGVEPETQTDQTDPLLL